MVRLLSRGVRDDIGKSLVAHYAIMTARTDVDVSVRYQKEKKIRMTLKYNIGDELRYMKVIIIKRKILHFLAQN